VAQWIAHWQVVAQWAARWGESEGLGVGPLFLG
jgi:hypothetical protein